MEVESSKSSTDSAFVDPKSETRSWSALPGIRSLRAVATPDKPACSSFSATARRWPSVATIEIFFGSSKSRAALRTYLCSSDETATMVCAINERRTETRETTIIADIFDNSRIVVINNLFIFRVSDGSAGRFGFNQLAQHLQQLGSQ